MLQETKTIKKYLLTINVDEEQLIKSYIGDRESIQLYNLPPIGEIIEFEMGFVSASGIHVEKVEEIKEE